MLLNYLLVELIVYQKTTEAIQNEGVDPCWQVGASDFSSRNKSQTSLVVHLFES